MAETSVCVTPAGCDDGYCLCQQPRACVHVRQRLKIKLTLCPCEHRATHAVMWGCVYSHIGHQLPLPATIACGVREAVVDKMTDFVMSELWSRVSVRIVACDPEGCQEQAVNYAGLRLQLMQSVLPLIVVGAESTAGGTCMHKKKGFSSCIVVITRNPTPVDYSPTSPTYSPTSPGY